MNQSEIFPNKTYVGEYGARAEVVAIHTTSAQGHYMGSYGESIPHTRVTQFVEYRTDDDRNLPPRMCSLEHFARWAYKEL